MIEKWKIYKPGRSGAGCSGDQSSLHQNGLACRSSIFQSIFNFSSEMESGNISPPLIKCQLRNSKILKNLITLIITQYISVIHCWCMEKKNMSYQINRQDNSKWKFNCPKISSVTNVFYNGCFVEDIHLLQESQLSTIITKRQKLEFWSQIFKALLDS